MMSRENLPVDSVQNSSETRDKYARFKSPEICLACDFSALSLGLRRRHFEALIPALTKMVRITKRSQEIRELTNGFAFGLPLDPNAAQIASEWALGESLCCPFLEIKLNFEGDMDVFWLYLTGGHGVKEFVESDFASWLR